MRNQDYHNDYKIFLIIVTMSKTNDKAVLNIKHWLDKESDDVWL